MYSDFLNKNVVDTIFKKTFKTNDTILIEKKYQTRCHLMELWLTSWQKEYQYILTIDHHDLESKLLCYETEYIEHKGESGHHYRHLAIKNFKTAKEYAQSSVFQFHGRNAYLWEKYKPTVYTAKEVILAKLSLCTRSRIDIHFCVFFNLDNELCFDLIYNKNPRGYQKFERDPEIHSVKTNMDAVTLFVACLKEEENNLAIQKKNKKIKQDKVDQLFSKGAVVTIKSILDPKSHAYEIVEEKTTIKIAIELRHGDAVIRIPRKNIKTRLNVLSELFDALVEANALGIECRFKRNH